MLVHAESVLGLVQNAVAGAAMDVLVLATTHLVGDVLGGRLGAVGLEATVQVVMVSLRSLVDDTNGGTYRAALSVVSVKVSLSFSWVDLEESGVIDSFASVEIVSATNSDMCKTSTPVKRHTGREILATGVSHVS